MARTQDTDFDIVIAGGGMVGATAALALAPLGLEVAVVEAAHRDAAAQPSFDDRSTALSRSSQRLYEALGLWPAIAASAAPIRHIHVSDSGRFGFSHIDASEQRVEALGYVVINRVLGEVLKAALAGWPNVHELCPARIETVTVDTERAAVTIATGEADRTEKTARLLVAADGARSSVREQLGIAVTHKAYGQQAIVGNLQTERDPGGTAYERFTPGGPLALLPMPGGRAGFIWTLDEAHAGRVLALDDAVFTAELQAAFGMRLGGFERVGRRTAYPLSLNKAARVVATRSVLIGNAAHGLHPVAAQGFNLGLRDVAALVDCVADIITEEDNLSRTAAPARARDRRLPRTGAAGRSALGDSAMLARYAEWRRADQRKLVSFTDGLVRLFTSERPPLRLLRDVGMLAFDLVPGVRREFARHTMGLAGRLPRLSRGIPLRRSFDSQRIDD